MSKKVQDVDYAPMLSPELNGRLGPLTTPADVLRFPLIDPGHPWWLAWFQTYQLPIEALEAQNTPSLGTQIFSASAALDGLGVAMLTPAYHRHSLRDGKLTQPFSATQERGWSYWLAYPESRRRLRKIITFDRWLHDAIRSAIG